MCATIGEGRTIWNKNFPGGTLDAVEVGAPVRYGLFDVLWLVVFSSHDLTCQLFQLVITREAQRTDL